jgi:hypothetical protein
MSFFFLLVQITQSRIINPSRGKGKTREKEQQVKEQEDENATRKLLYNNKEKLLPQICSKHSTFLLPSQLGASPCQNPYIKPGKRGYDHYHEIPVPWARIVPC